MANLWSGRIDTNNDYVDLGELAGVTFQADTTYFFQAVDTCTICISESKPTSGGFTIYSGPLVRFEVNSGEKVWIKTFNGLKVSMNLAK